MSIKKFVAATSLVAFSAAGLTVVSPAMSASAAVVGQSVSSAPAPSFSLAEYKALAALRDKALANQRSAKKTLDVTKANYVKVSKSFNVASKANVAAQKAYKKKRSATNRKKAAKTSKNFLVWKKKFAAAKAAYEKASRNYTAATKAANTAVTNFKKFEAVYINNGQVAPTPTPAPAPSTGSSGKVTFNTLPKGSSPYIGKISSDATVRYVGDTCMRSMADNHWVRQVTWEIKGSYVSFAPPMEKSVNIYNSSHQFVTYIDMGPIRSGGMTVNGATASTNVVLVGYGEDNFSDAFKTVRVDAPLHTVVCN